MPLTSATLSPTDEQLAIGQFIALSASANVYLELVRDRLTIHAVGADWTMWRPLSRCLDEIGIPRIEQFFRTTSPLERERLFRAA